MFVCIFGFCRAVVSLGERQRSIGGAAKQQIVSNFKNTVWGWKKLIARQFNDPQVQHEQSLLPYDIVQQPDGSAGIRVSDIFTCLIGLAHLFRALTLLNLYTYNSSDMDAAHTHTHTHTHRYMKRKIFR